MTSEGWGILAAVVAGFPAAVGLITLVRWLLGDFNRCHGCESILVKIRERPIGDPAPGLIGTAGVVMPLGSTHRCPECKAYYIVGVGKPRHADGLEL